MPAPAVSVIMSVRNAAPYLRAAIDSVLAQSLPPDEIILIDGQSEDGTAAIAQTYPQVRYLPQPNRGLASARNLGIRMAEGDLLAFLDGDDLWAPEKQRRQLAHLAAVPGALYSVGYMRLFADGDAATPERYSAAAFAEGQIGYTPGAMLAHRQLFERVGEFDASYTLAGDTDWFARVLDAGIPTANLDEVVLLKRIHADNASHDLPLYRKEMARVVRTSLLRRQRS